MPDTRRSPLTLPAKIRLVFRVWRWFFVVRGALRRRPLPQFVTELGQSARVQPDGAQPPGRLSRAVDRALRVGSRQPTCLVRALVLFRLLREQGDPAELVIGLPPDARDKTAHAWVELEGVDVGPAPGRGQHVPLARFG